MNWKSWSTRALVRSAADDMIAHGTRLKFLALEYDKLRDGDADLEAASVKACLELGNSLALLGDALELAGAQDVEVLP